MRKKLLALLLSAVMVITMTGTILAESLDVSSGVAPSEPALSEVVFDEDSGTIGSSSVALPENLLNGVHSDLSAVGVSSVSESG